MKLIISIIKNFRNVFPYFVLIGIYFFFISLEANKEYRRNVIIEKENYMPQNKSYEEDREFRINIPVVPYKN